MVAELSREAETGQSLITDSTDMTMSEFVELARERHNSIRLTMCICLDFQEDTKQHCISSLSARMKMQIARILITELQQWTF